MGVALRTPSGGPIRTGVNSSSQESSVSRLGTFILSEVRKFLKRQFIPILEGFDV